MRRSRSPATAEAVLTFQWKDPDRPALRLGFFLILSLAAHVGCFYLFQVVYPKSDRALPYTATLTVLNPEDPVAREAMERIADRVAGIDAATREDAPGTRLEDYASNFTPFFRDYRLEPKDPPALYPPPSTPDIYAAGAPSLPPLSLNGGATPVAIPVTTAPPFTRLPHIMVRGGSLEKRDLSKAVDWSGIGASLADTEQAFVSFFVGVDSGGRVVHSLLSQGDDTGLTGLLGRRVRALRFLPVKGGTSADLQWGWIDISW